jgi:hypothetical protein
VNQACKTSHISKSVQETRELSNTFLCIDVQMFMTDFTSDEGEVGTKAGYLKNNLLFLIRCVTDRLQCVT